MRRLMIAALAVLSITPALAAMDSYTQFLESEPITHLDWVVFNAKQAMVDIFERPQGQYAEGQISSFKSQIATRGMTYKRTTAYYDFDGNQFTLFVLAEKKEMPTVEDCTLLLEQARDAMLHHFKYQPAYPLDDNDRKQAASEALSEFAIGPSAVGRVGEPKDMNDHLAALTIVRATANKENDYRGVSCTGALGGTDVEFKVK